MTSLRSATRLLAQFASGRATYTVTELAGATGLSKSHVSKVLAAFCDAGLVTQHPASQAFSVGVRSFVLGSQYFNNDQLSREAIAILGRLTEKTGHSTRLCVPDADRVVYLIGVNGPLFVDTAWKMGTYLPMHSTSAGRVLLAFMDAAAAERLLAGLALPKMTESTVTLPQELRKLLAQVRQKGVAVSRGENTPGLSAIAVPVFDAARRNIAVLNLAYPSHMVGRQEENALLVPLQRAARTLSQRMGCPVYPFGAGS